MAKADEFWTRAALNAALEAYLQVVTCKAGQTSARPARNWIDQGLGPRSS